MSHSKLSKFYDIPKLHSSSGWTTWRMKTLVLFERRELRLEPPPQPGLRVKVTAEWQAAWLRERRQQVLAARPTATATATSSSTPPLKVTFGGGDSSTGAGSGTQPVAAYPAEPTEEEIGPIPTEREETMEEYAKRKLEYATMNKEIYSDLVLACTGEALNLIIEAENGDGWGAFQRLEKEYGSASANSQFMVIKALIDLKQTGSVHEHVNKFKQLLRRLHEMKITMVDSVVSVMFLRSLKSQYKQFVTNAMMNGNMQTEKLYTAACEYSKAHLAASDESKNPGLAMHVQCPEGANCAGWRNNECRKFHPYSGAQNKGTKRKRAEEKGKSKVNWTCGSCQFYNFARNDKCLKCKAPRTGGQQTRSNKWYQAKLAELSQKNLEEKKAAKQQMAMLGIEDTLSDDDGEPIETADLARDVDLAETALATQERRTRMRFTVDSGASSHFVNSGVPLTSTRAQQSQVQAAGGKLYPITAAGTCTGATESGSTVSFEAKRCKAFSHNLFSVFEAARNGHRTVFDWDSSYIQNKTTGEKIPLERRSSGWTLTLEKPTTHGA